MAAPVGTKTNRWNQVVSAVASARFWTSAVADTWLNQVWANRFTDEVGGSLPARDDLCKWLEANTSGAATLPKALEAFLL